MVNKFLAWKKRQDPPITTNKIAEILDISPGWVSTLLNQKERGGGRRCSYDLALKISLMTGGEVEISDMMSDAQDVRQVRQEIRKRLRRA